MENTTTQIESEMQERLNCLSLKGRKEFYKVFHFGIETGLEQLTAEYISDAEYTNGYEYWNTYAGDDDFILHDLCNWFVMGCLEEAELKSIFKTIRGHVSDKKRLIEIFSYFDDLNNFQILKEVSYEF